MAVTKFSNSMNPKLMTALVVSLVVVSLACFVLFVCLDNDWSLVFQIAYMLAYAAAFPIINKMNYCVVDDEKGIVYTHENRKHPINVPEISYVILNESKRGRFRFLFIHDTGIGFVRIVCKRRTAEAIVAKLRTLNPSFEVRHANYI